MYGLHTAIASYDAITHSGGRGGGTGRDSSQKAYTHALGAIAGVGMGMGVTPVMTATTAAVASSGGFTMPWLDHATTVRIDIHPDGRIVYAEELPGRSAAWLSLDGICFMVSSSTDTSTTATSTISASAPPTTTSTTTTIAIMRRRLLEGKVEEEMKEEEEDSKLVLDRKVDLNGTLFRWNGSEVSDHAGTIQNDINSSRALVYGSVGNE